MGVPRSLPQGKRVPSLGKRLLTCFPVFPPKGGRGKTFPQKFPHPGNMGARGRIPHPRDTSHGTLVKTLSRKEIDIGPIDTVESMKESGREGEDTRCAIKVSNSGPLLHIYFYFRC